MAEARPTMRAVRYESYGGGPDGLKHVDIPVPAPKKGEVLLKLEATSINPVDWKTQKGMLRPIFPAKFPHIPGTDVGGEVVEVGPAVEKFKPGDKVVALLDHFKGGGFGEFAVAKESLMVARPPEVSAPEGAGLPVAGLTALQALTQAAGVKLDGSGPPKNILITAASGGVGHYASLGADEVLDYKTPEGSTLKSPSDKKYDFVVHCAHAFPWSVFEPNLSERGKVIDITPSFGSMMTFALKKLTFSKKQLAPLLLTAKGENLEFLVKLVKEGKLKTAIDSTYPLSQVKDAWEKSISGHATGKQSMTVLQRVPPLQVAEEKLMRVVRYDSYGGGAAGLKHVKVPVPEPKNDKVLLKLEAVTINPVDWKIQSGMLRSFLPPKFPLHTWSGSSFCELWYANNSSCDVAGEVVEVGPGVENFKPGDKVVAYLSISNGGGFAEFAIANESLTVARPPEVSAPEGAGLPVAGLTALQALTQAAGVKLDGSGPLKNILITAASGGVGHFAVQLAKLGNTHVTATCGARNIDFVKSLGADEVLDYKTPEGAALKSPSGKKYDFVVHCAHAFPWSVFKPNLSEYSKVIDLTPGISTMTTSALKKLTFSKKQLEPLLLTPKGENLEFLVKLAKEGKIKTAIDSKYPLSKAEDAWAKSMSGHATGKIIVEP
ncbi:hypothetical protein NL676_002312 [Syzygium grande]|nr:hypothetical protein NL676_002312 [Syzygium grande]